MRIHSNGSVYAMYMRHKTHIHTRTLYTASIDVLFEFSQTPFVRLIDSSIFTCDRIVSRIDSVDLNSSTVILFFFFLFLSSPYHNIHLLLVLLLLLLFSAFAVTNLWLFCF